MHMVTILPIPILRITIVREPQLSAGFAGKSRNRGTLIYMSPCLLLLLTDKWAAHSAHAQNLQGGKRTEERRGDFGPFLHVYNFSQPPVTQCPSASSADSTQSTTDKDQLLPLQLE